MTKQAAKELETITARQLRSILFNADEAMTVGELRAFLFKVTDQDKAYNINLAMFLKMAQESDK